MLLTAPAPSELEDLYRRHRARVVRLCRLMLADPDEAADVAQDVFLRVERTCRDGVAPTDWTPWIVRVTVNACHDRRRSGWWRWWRGSGGVSLDIDHLVAAGRSPEEEAARREQRAQVWDALRRLPARQRDVFVLRHVEGLSTDAVAELLGIAPGSVKRHLFRAVHALRRGLGVEP